MTAGVRISITLGLIFASSVIWRRSAGQVGGIIAACRVFQYAQAHGVTLVNHTFTSHWALNASFPAYAGAAEHGLCEYLG